MLCLQFEDLSQQLREVSLGVLHVVDDNDLGGSASPLRAAPPVRRHGNATARDHGREELRELPTARHRVEGETRDGGLHRDRAATATGQWREGQPCKVKMAISW